MEHVHDLRVAHGSRPLSIQEARSTEIWMRFQYHMPTWNFPVYKYILL